MHQSEKDRIKQLAKGNAQAEERLTAAACALVKCYAEDATGSAAYERAAALATWGNAPELAAERQTIAQQQGLFSYSTSDKLQDFGKWTGNTAIQTGKDVGKLVGQIATHGPNALPQTPPDLPSDDQRPPSGTAGAVVTPAIPLCLPPVCVLTPPVVVPTNAMASTGNNSGDRNSSGGGENSADKPNLLDPKGETHVLDGDKTGGGHRSVTGKPGKSEFPSGWSDDRIKGEISDVATDPASSRSPSRGGREVVRGTRGGIDIEVIVESDGRIVTGYPTNVPRNPR